MTFSRPSLKRRVSPPKQCPVSHQNVLKRSAVFIIPGQPGICAQPEGLIQKVVSQVQVATRLRPFTQ
jgi:hypothetical protein